MIFRVYLSKEGAFMPGTYAHMIAADKAKDKIVEADSLIYFAKCLLEFPEWLQSGTVGPDYPYLHHALTSHDLSDSWADLMHYTSIGDLIHNATVQIREMYNQNSECNETRRNIAWFLGFISHIVLDITIHPVVRLVVGEYKDNPDEHRSCEMFMDTYIYNTTYKSELSNSEWIDYLRSVSSEYGMDSQIVTFWNKLLNNTYPHEYKKNQPQIHKWHKKYIKKLDCADINVGFFRHCFADKGWAYPSILDIREEEYQKYIHDLPLPKGNCFDKNSMNYDEIFKNGIKNIVFYWKKIMSLITSNDNDFSFFKNWNLDTGIPVDEEDSRETVWY
jgi:hypothetical protein